MDTAHENTESGLCPRCGQGGLHIVELTPIQNKRVWLCEECDALWDQSESPWIDMKQHVDFSDYMKPLGFNGLWDFVTIIK
jgi:hypothetical protein